jgi:transcriptional regulator of arginine metabolism
MSDKINSLLRQEAIKKLISTVQISDQKKLVDLLKEKFGIETNQSVVSRDLRKLGVIKKEFDHKLCYALPNFNVINELLKLAIIKINYNETMIVIKTHPGLAAFVGDYIDQQDHPNILGCLAGENVVFITCESIKKIHETYEIICQILNFKMKII